MLPLSEVFTKFEAKPEIGSAFVTNLAPQFGTHNCATGGNTISGCLIWVLTSAKCTLIDASECVKQLWIEVTKCWTTCIENRHIIKKPLIFCLLPFTAQIRLWAWIQGRSVSAQSGLPGHAGYQSKGLLGKENEPGSRNLGGGYVVRSNIPTFIIDPIMLFREGLRFVLQNSGFQPVWCSDGPPAGPVAAVSGQESPLLIVGTDVEEAMVQVAEMRRLYPTSRLVLMLDDMSREQVMSAVRCGVRTIICKNTSCEALIGTLNLVLDGATVLPSDVLDALLDFREVGPKSITHCQVVPEIETVKITDVSPQQGAGLTAREMGVLDWLRHGLPNKEIARRMQITDATVKVHVKAILRKTGARNRTQVAIWAPKLENALQTNNASSENEPTMDLGDSQNTLSKHFSLIVPSVESLRGLSG
jgi:two-component system, NarL family, nitrate/nitrite response regulator NarL